MNLATREAYGNTLAELKDNENVVVLEADLGHATKSLKFKEVCPQRFFNMGIAEADMIGTAAGLAACGKVPFASTFSVFATGRAFDQVRNSVCYPNLNVENRRNACRYHGGRGWRNTSGNRGYRIDALTSEYEHRCTIR